MCDPGSLQQLLGLFGRQLLQHACLTSGCRMHHFLHHFFRLLWSHQGTPLHDAVIFSPFGTHPCHRVGRRNCLIRIQRTGNQTRLHHTLSYFALNYCKKCTSHSICFNAHCTEASLTWFANLDHFWMISKKYSVWKSKKMSFPLIERTPYRAHALKRTLFWSHTFLSASLFERTFFESTLYWLSARFIERTFHWAHVSLSALYHERTL